MKTLYEIMTTHLGESYVRSYCWAECEEDARELFRAVATGKRGEQYEISRVVPLFQSDALEFVTQPSDCGFETEGIVRLPLDLRALGRVPMDSITRKSEE